jgi:RNA-dependent RNA polymerase
MYTEKAMMVMDAITPGPGTRIEFDLNLAQKRVDIRFPLQSSGNANQEHPDVELYRFEIPFYKLSDVYATQNDSSKKVLVIPLVAPPEFYRRTKDIQATHDARAYNWSDWQTWFRQTDIVFDSARLETTPIQFRKEDARIDIGKYSFQAI